MKLAIIGSGKTGSEVLRLSQPRHQVQVFNSKTPPSVEALRNFDVAIVFVPAVAFAGLAPILWEAKIPVVCGTTGFDFSLLSTPKAPWIIASNFSLGMNTVFLFAKLMTRLEKLAPGASFSIREVHHTEKKDSPSGTALYLQSLLPQKPPIVSERIADVRGTHSLELALPGEILRIYHEALDRSIFAQGALWSAEALVPFLDPGMHRFESLLETRLREEFNLHE